METYSAQGVRIIILAMNVLPISLKVRQEVMFFVIIVPITILEFIVILIRSATVVDITVLATVVTPIVSASIADIIRRMMELILWNFTTFRRHPIISRFKTII